MVRRRSRKGEGTGCAKQDPAGTVWRRPRAADNIRKAAGAAWLKTLHPPGVLFLPAAHRGLGHPDLDAEEGVSV